MKVLPALYVPAHEVRLIAREDRFDAGVAAELALAPAAPDVQGERYVGDVDQLVLPNLSIDDYVFGVAAVGPGGHESLVSPYVRPPRQMTEVRRTGG